mgnify:CR=1 FL=1
MTDLTWYIFRTEPQYEFKAEETLGRAGFVAFVPREYTHVKRRRGGNRSIALRKHPRMPGYIIVGIEGQPNWFQLFDQRQGFGSTLKSVVGIGGLPEPVSNEAINRLQREQGEFIPHRSSVPTRRDIRPGQTAEVITGPYRGSQGKIDNIRGGVATIMMQMFGTEMPVAMPVANIDAA